MSFPTRLLRICCAWLACSGLVGCESDDGKNRDDTWSPSESGDSGQVPSGQDSGAKEAGAAGNDSGTPARDGGVTPPADGGVTTTPMDSGTTLPSEAGTATDASSATDGAAGDAGIMPPFSTFPPVTDAKAAGPYKTKTVNRSGPGSAYTIFQPDPLGAEGVKHPVLTWGNGGGTTPSLYSDMLSHLASHGFVVIASNTAPSAGQAGAQSLGKEMVAGVDWLLMQNGMSGSAYFGKLDPGHIAPFGYSMGGLATTSIVGDPRFTTTVHLSGGTGTMADVRPMLAKSHAPMFWECGETDIAKSNCDMDFANATTQSVFYGTLLNADHFTIIGNDANIRGSITAWFRIYLMNDQTFKPMFSGADCTLCKDTRNWKVQKKNHD